MKRQKKGGGNEEERENGGREKRGKMGEGIKGKRRIIKDVGSTTH